MSELQVFNFEGRALPSYTFRGRECWIAQDVARVLGYETKGWSSSWRRWVEGDELLDGQDFTTLRGPDLREFKAVLGDTADPAVSSTARLTVLFEPGLNVVCILTEKPLGKKLRRFVAEKVLPDLRRRSVDVDRLRDELLSLNLRLSAAEQPSIWERDVVVAGLCRIYRKPWDGRGVWPMWLKQPLGRVYKIVLGATVYDELKRRNPRPRDGSLHYQYLSDTRHTLMTGRDMARVQTVLNFSSSSTQFFERLTSEFGRGPRQLEMGGA